MVTLAGITHICPNLAKTNHYVKYSAKDFQI